jgi:glycosyltransferase involved in cell wall biosynthesis
MISVIIPTFRSPDALDLCLQSCVEGQTQKNQIIVVVDGFYDINKDVLEKYSSHIDILNMEENVGLCRGTNLGVYNAQHDKILIVNDDNIFPYHWDVNLEKIYQPNSCIAPNQIEPIPSMFRQFHIENLGRDPKVFDLDNFWKFEKEYKILEQRYEKLSREIEEEKVLETEEENEDDHDDNSNGMIAILA